MVNLKYPILMADCLMKENILYFFAKNCNALYAFDIEDESCTLLGRIPEEEVLCENLVGTLLCFEGKLIMTPQKMVANKIWIYDLKRETWEFIEIDIDNVETPLEKIAYATIYDDELVLVGCFYNGIIKVNLRNGKIEYYKNILDGEDEIHSLYCCIVEGQYLLVPSPNRNRVTKVDLRTGSYEAITVGNSGFAYSGICKVGDYYWLAPRKTLSYIVKWNGRKEYQIYDLPEEIKKNGKYIFCGVYGIGNEVYMIGGRRKRMIIFDANNYDTSQTVSETYAFIKCESEKEYILQDYVGNTTIVRNERRCSFCMERTYTELCDELPVMIFNNKIISEGDSVDLRLFIEMLVRMKAS